MKLVERPAAVTQRYRPRRRLALRLTRAPWNDVAVIFLAGRRRRLGIIDPFVLAARFLDLRHRVTGVRRRAFLRDEQTTVCEQQCHFRRALDDAIVRHEQELEDVRIGLDQELDHPPQAVVDRVAAIVPDLIRRSVEIEIRGARDREDAADVLIAGRCRCAIGPASSNALEENGRGLLGAQSIQRCHASNDRRSGARTPKRQGRTGGWHGMKVSARSESAQATVG
jgi:hypothetical protein